MSVRARITCFALLLGASGTALAGNGLAPGELKVDPATLHALGWRWLVTGDDNKNARGTVEYRRSGDASWRTAPEALRIDGEPAGIDGWICGNLFAGSVLGLEPGTSYDVRITLSDPDGVTGTAQQTFTSATRAIPPAIAGNHVLPVYTSCTGRPSPCYTDLVNAAKAAQPGDVVLIHAGTYAWTTLVDLSFLSARATTEAQPIVFRGENVDTVIVDHGVAPRGSTQEMFYLVGTKHLRFETFTVKNAGVVFYARDAVGLVVRDMKMLSVYQGVGGGTSPKAKDANWWIADNEIVGWNTQWYPYSSPSTSIAGVGIRVYGKGHVVEHNTVGKFWDCIAHSDTGGGQVTNATVDWTNPPSMDIDFDDNEMYECFDDALSADYGFHNIRMQRNRMTNAHTAISVQPVYGGPTYVVRNVAFNMAANSFKLHNQPPGTEAYHNTFAVHDFAWQCDAGWLNSRIRDNLMLASTSTTSYSLVTGTPKGDPRNVLDYNGYSGTTGTNLVKWNRAPYGGSDWARYHDLPAFAAGEGFEAHGRTVDWSIFENAWYPAGEGTTYAPGQADLDLRPAASAVDAGVAIPGIDETWTGAAPDLGAYELGATAPLYGRRALLPPGEASDPRTKGAAFTVAKEAAQYRLRWSAPPDGGAPDRYSLYATALAGRFQPACEAANLGAGTTALVAALTSNRGLVVVARNAAGEGSYGRGSNAGERAYAASACP